MPGYELPEHKQEEEERERQAAKVLQDIAGMTMLDRVIERVKRARSPNAVVVATSTLAIDDAIAGGQPCCR